MQKGTTMRIQETIKEKKWKWKNKKNVMQVLLLFLLFALSFMGDEDAGKTCHYLALTRLGNARLASSFFYEACLWLETFRIEFN